MISLDSLRLLLDHVNRVEDVQLLIVELTVPFDLYPADLTHFHNELHDLVQLIL
jgi:hypothetical protein